MELVIPKLVSPRRRFASAQLSFDYENTSSPGTPTGTAPVSPLARSRDEEDYEMVFEQHQAAIPFTWEEKPGTPRGARRAKEEGSGSEEDEESDAVNCSNPSSRNSSSRKTDDSSEFEFSSSETSEKTSSQSKPADELFARGQILPLKPPPRLQSIKQFLAADVAVDDAVGCDSPHRTPGHSFRKEGLRTPTRSFRKDGLKAFIPSPRREKSGEQVTTMLGFEEWPKDEIRRDGPGHRRANSLSKLPSLFRRKYGLGKENDHDDELENQNSDGDASGRKSCLGAENRRPRDCLSSRTLGGSFGNDDFFQSSRSTFEHDARIDFFNTSGRTIPEEEVEARDEEHQQQQEPQIEATDHILPEKKQGKLSRFFTKKPSRLSTVVPSPSSSSSADDFQIKRSQHTSPLLKLCLSNCIGQAFVRGVNHFRSLDSQQQPRRALSAAR